MNRRPLVRRARRRPFPLQFEAMESRLLLAILVSTAADNGDNLNPTPGSLRQAILDANAATVPATIDFQIGSGGLQVIYPLSALPEITNSVTIDGTSQPGFTYYPLIAIDGISAGPNANGLTISAGNSKVQGLDIVEFSGNGIDLNSKGGDVVDSSIIGTDIIGTAGLGNAGSGVMIDDVSGNVIGTSLATGNVLSGNKGAGLTISGGGAKGNLVQGNYIGTDFSGTQAVGNGTGVAIIAAPDNTIGGASSSALNLISGNGGDGVSISSTGPIMAFDNVVEGNIIGLDATGAMFLRNNGDGVRCASGSATIGGTTPAAQNIISGNRGNGVDLGPQALDTVVEGNYIGTDASGATTTDSNGNFLGNEGDGVQCAAGFSTIGGTTPAARNIISGNFGNGVTLETQALDTVVEGNYIGTDASGATTTDSNGNFLGNFGDGVRCAAGFSTIGGTTSAARNIISGNSGNGITLGTQAGETVVEGNYIGTDVNGETSLFNEGDGVQCAAISATIGGTTPAARNIISGNASDGVTLEIGAGETVVEGNIIGLDVNGEKRLFNAGDGVRCAAGAATIGGTTPGARNIISGNFGNGIEINGLAARDDVVQGDFIGLDITGTHALANSGDGVVLLGLGASIELSDLIGGTTAAARNVISGNGHNGVSVSNATAVGIVGNFIGTDCSGTQPVPNEADGVLLDSSPSNTIGGTTSGAGNLISGNGQAGVEVRNASATGNVIRGNTIGTDVTGEAFLGGAEGLSNLVGVFINGAKNNTIGGTDSRAGNLISGNSNLQGSGVGVQILGFGVTDNLVEGNLIGTDKSGGHPLGNDTGVFINGAAANTIGGTVQGAGNVIAGYTTASAQVGVGVDIANAGAMDNLVVGNLIGTDATGKQALVPSQQPASGIGVLINSTSGSNTIGGVTAAARNVISGFVIAIDIYAAQSSFNLVPGNTVEGNYIGTNAFGVVVKGLGNTGNTTGIFVNGVPFNTIGGVTAAARNVISGNTTGIYLLGPTASGNLVQGNYIGLDPTGTSAEPNHSGVFVNDATNNTIGGTAPGAGNVIAGNLPVGQDGSTGIFFYQGAAGNLVQGNRIGTNASGNPGKRLGLGDYGILLYNAPRNTYPTRGKGANKIRGSGIAATREFSSSAPLATTSGTTSKGRAKLVPSGPRALVRRPRSRK